MSSTRTSGILLHPTSLPSRFGIGDLGPEAYRFLDWLAGAEQQMWQVLPLSPPDEDWSPYQSFSALAGNPLLISPERLADEGLLAAEEVERASQLLRGDAIRVNFSRVAAIKGLLLDRAAENFRRLAANHPLRDAFQAFRRRESDWLNDYATFMALREANQGRPWTEWTVLVNGAKQPVANAIAILRERIEAHELFQWLFYRQWTAVEQYAGQRGIKIIGDLPIYVASQSADVWAHRSLFQLDGQGRATHMAGVPPDYFSRTGQLWGNPLYDWQAMQHDGYRWWITRIETALETADLLRLDHFRGFEAYWSVPAGDLTAENGQWVDGPGDAFFEAIGQALRAHNPCRLTSSGRLPFIAEDLGLITKPVTKLRKHFGLPGMMVLQFVLLGETETPFVADEVDPNTLICTGTHDNNTSVGWYRQLLADNPKGHVQLREHLPHVPSDPTQIAWQLIEVAWQSSADMAVAPLQDFLALDANARMNVPGTTQAGFPNWSWRFRAEELTEELQRRLAKLTRHAGRAA